MAAQASDWLIGSFLKIDLNNRNQTNW